MSGKRSSDLPRAGLSARRRRTRRRAFVLLVVLFVIVIAGLIWGTHQSKIRISHIAVYGLPVDRQAPILDIANHALQGSYFGLIPRNSAFFVPASSIRASILAAHSEIAAVSVFTNGLTDLSIKIVERAPIAQWCGLAPTEGVDPYCYVFDASGVIFAPVSTSTEPINPIILYAPLVQEALEPLRATIAHAELLPGVFDFARELQTFGSSVSSIVIRDGEVDQYMASGTPSTKSDLVLGTRVTYVLGDEAGAYAALASARGAMNLADGSLEYVDLRFSGKVYTKKKTVGSTQEE